MANDELQQWLDDDEITPEEYAFLQGYGVL